MVYAASLPKIAILLGAAVAIDEGRLELDDELQTDLDDMIRYSCNACATKVLEMVGRQELLEILQSPEYKFYDQDEAGGFWVGKDYGPARPISATPCPVCPTVQQRSRRPASITSCTREPGQPGTVQDDAGRAFQARVFPQIRQGPGGLP